MSFGGNEQRPVRCCLSHWNCVEFQMLTCSLLNAARSQSWSFANQTRVLFRLIKVFYSLEARLMVVACGCVRDFLSRLIIARNRNISMLLSAGSCDNWTANVFSRRLPETWRCKLFVVLCRSLLPIQFYCMRTAWYAGMNIHKSATPPEFNSSN